MLNINFNPFPVLSTDRFILRKLVEEDAPEVYIQRSNATINKFIHREPAKNEGEALEWIKKILDNEENNVSINWSIVPKGETRLIGTICLWNLDRENNRGELGYSLHHDYFGRGIMSEVTTKILEYGFKIMNLDRMDAYTNKDNKASLNLLQKKGFKRNFDFERDFEDKEELEYNIIYTLLKEHYTL